MSTRRWIDDAAIRAHWRGLVFTLLCSACVMATVGYGVVVRSRTADAIRASAAEPSTLAAVRQSPHVMFRRTGPSDTYGRVAIAALDGANASSISTSLDCERIHFAAGSGICLTADRGVLTSFSAMILDADLRPRLTLPLAGAPNRTRVSPDGRQAAFTVFVSGDSYAGNAFSTRTSIVDVAEGSRPVNLESFTISRDNAPFESVDFNFWGVTFGRDGDRFYATLASQGCTYLIEGSIDARAARVVRGNVEYPSLAPDDTRIAFKERIEEVGLGGRPIWRLALLDLATLDETLLTTETRSIDDQIEWLDDGHILYAARRDEAVSSAVTDIWMLAVDGSGPPELFVPEAESPVVVR